jgi:uncharacterized protein (DUF1778 family)
MSKNKDPKLDFSVKSTEIKLSERDFKKFIEVLENPPEPNEKLKWAAKKYFENEQNDNN